MGNSDGFQSNSYNSEVRNKMSWSIIQIIIFAMGLTKLIIHSQFSPVWQSSPFIEAKSIVLVSNAQKTFGNYTVNVPFSRAFSTPTLALSIPQLRIVSSLNHSFKVHHSNLSATAYIHNLYVPDATTTVWYLVSRYILFEADVLSKEFQTYFGNDFPGINIRNNTNGTYRSDSFLISLSASATVSNNPVCLPFLTGASGTSADHYQLNITCTIETASTAKVTATVFPSTQVFLLSFYLVVWDPVVLAVQSYLFVDYAVTTTYYNVQKTFLSLPYGFIDANYFGGLASFSTTINHALNISLNSLILTTSSDSLYDSAPQFQVRIRNCSANVYPWYNKADGLCYLICPTYTYQVTESFLCNSCPQNCKSCLNFSRCTTCSTGMAVINGYCDCINSSYLFNGVCYGCHYSCLTCTTGQYYNCLTCDAAAFRTPILTFSPSYKCECSAGYKDTFTKVCQQICGDGVAKTDACDDGNSVSGDGCSNKCMIEQNFTCTMNSSNFSRCYYIGNVTISYVKTIKALYQNKIKVYLRVDPWIGAMNQLANSISLTSNLSNCIFGYSSEYNLLVYQISYKEEIEKKSVTIFLNPTSSGIFSIMPPANVTIKMYSDNGYMLKFYTSVQYKVADSVQYITQVLGDLMLVSAFLFIFGRLKWLGNLLFFSLQFMYLSMLMIPYFTPMLAGMVQIKSILGFNDLYGQQDFDLPKYPAFNVLNFSKQYSYNVNLMVLLQVLALLMYFIYFITYRNNQKLCKKYGGDPQKTYKALKYGKFLIFFDWQFFMFWTFFNMTQQITAMILFTELPDPSYLPLIFFNAACIFLAVFPLIGKRKQVKSYTELIYCKDRGQQQSLVSLGFFALMYAFLAISITLQPKFYFLIFIFPILMIIYLLCRKPFQSKWMRAAYFINCLCMIIMLTYNQLIIHFSDDVYYLPFGSIITIMFDWIFNLVVWGRQAYVICKYGGERDLNELLQQNTKTSSNNNNNDEGFFRQRQMLQKGNHSFLNSIMKNQVKRELKRNKNIDENMPQGLKDEHQAAVDQEQEQQRSQIRKKRQNYLKEMKEMKQIKEYRERLRMGLDEISTPTKSKIRTTGQKGLQLARINEINMAGFKMCYDYLF